MKHPRGALLPPGHEWEEGKTAGTICFVKSIERYLSSDHEVSPELSRFLESSARLAKEGHVVVTAELIIEAD